MKYKITKHAQAQLARRGIELDSLPAIWANATHWPDPRYTDGRRKLRCGDLMLAYAIHGDEASIITVFDTTNDI